MYKTLWNYIKNHNRKHSVISIFLPVLVLGWTAVGLLAGVLICPLLQNASVLVKTTVVLCSGGYAGLIFGFFGGIFYIYRGTVKKSTAAVRLLQVEQN